MIKSINGYLFILCLLFVVTPIKAESSYSALYVFGDSLSDTGNLATIIGDFPAAYFNNRASNGPLAVEALAGSLNLPLTASFHLIGQELRSSYAVASARAAGDQAIDLETQVNAFLVAHAYIAHALYKVVGELDDVNPE